MNLPEKTIQLPETFLGSDRQFMMRHSSHGDIRLGIRAGDEPTKNFGLSHSHEPLLVAACMGYYARLGIGRNPIQTIFAEVARDVLAEIPLSEAQRSNSDLHYIAENEPMSPKYDLPGNLKCLVFSTPASPGTTERNASTGIYTKEHESGALVLVLAGLPPHRDYGDIPAEQIVTAELCQEDIPEIAKVVCDLAMGESRYDIAALLYEFSGELDDDI